MQKTKASAAPAGSVLEQRHQMERPEIENAFARLAVDHPDHVQNSLKTKGIKR